MDPTRRVYLKNPENRESLSAVECINGVGQDTPPMLIISGVNILIPWFFNDLADDLLVITSESRNADDWMSPQWIKHFDRFSARCQQGVYRLLIMDSYGSHHTKEFLDFCEENARVTVPYNAPTATARYICFPATEALARGSYRELGPNRR